jgi:hypothetical protein
MPCDRKLKQGQTLAERAREVRKAGEAIDRLLAQGRVKVRIDRIKGGIMFEGIPDGVRDGLTDNCIYRRITTSGSAQARLALARAEQLAGRSVDRKAVAQGLHSHDGVTWGNH